MLHSRFICSTYFLIFVTLINVTVSQDKFLENHDHNPKALGFPENSIKLGGKYYLIEANIKLSWYQAERYCRRNNGYLASLKTSNEWELVNSYLLIKEYSDENNLFWIGGNDLGSEGTFYLSETGDVMPYIRWKSGEPNKDSNTKDCLSLRNDRGEFRASDLDCGSINNFICEFEE